MNGISILIYLIGVIPGFSALFLWIGWLLVIPPIVLSFFVLMAVGTQPSSTKAEEEIKAVWTWVTKNLWKFVISGMIIVVLGIAIPPKQTMVLIAASEIAEEVIAIEEIAEVGGEAGLLIKESIGLLRGYISEEIQNLDIKDLGEAAVKVVTEEVTEQTTD